jgi:hypothetical protein
MNVLTRNNLKLMMDIHRGPCISLFMPMHRSGPETQQDLIRFKNLIREAEERLITRGIPAPASSSPTQWRRTVLYFGSRSEQGQTASRHTLQLELLFAVPDFQQWGTFDPSTDEIHLHKKEKTGDEDLLESTAIQTLLNGGTVYVVKPGTMPDTGSLAAVFRY